MGVLHVWVDVEAGDAEVDVTYISFNVSVQYIRQCGQLPGTCNGSTKQLEHPLRFVESLISQIH